MLGHKYFFKFTCKFLIDFFLSYKLYKNGNDIMTYVYILMTNVACPSQGPWRQCLNNETHVFSLTCSRTQQPLSADRTTCRSRTDYSRCPRVLRCPSRRGFTTTTYRHDNTRSTHNEPIVYTTKFNVRFPFTGRRVVAKVGRHPEQQQQP